MIDRLARDESDEPRIIEAATAACLIARQRADDLPAEFDLDDVTAAYEGFEDDLRRQLAGGALPGDQADDGHGNC